MNLPRREFLHLAALPATSRIARAQAYPTRPITMIVPESAGGPGDNIARVLVERMRTSLGQSIIIENVGGADGSIAVGRAARARPDGYTIDLGVLPTHVLNGAFYSLQYDVVNEQPPWLHRGDPARTRLQDRAAGSLRAQWSRGHAAGDHARRQAADW